MTTFLLWLSGIVLVCGVANLVWMLRESRVGLNPTCRQCGYDLRGIWKRINQCPECGGDVRIVARGHWKFEWRLIIGPVLLLMLGLSVGAVALAPRIHKALARPTSTLLADTLSFDRKLAAAAFAELQERRTEGKLSSTETLLFAAALKDRAKVERLVRNLPQSARTLGEARSALIIWNQLIKLGVDAPKPAVDERYLSPLEVKTLELERAWEEEAEPLSPQQQEQLLLELEQQRLQPQQKPPPVPQFRLVPEESTAPKPPPSPGDKPTGRFDPY